MLKGNAAITPGLELALDIFRYKYGLAGPADQPELLRAGFGSDKRKQGLPSWRGNQNEAAMFPEVVINLQAESKLVHVESKASILIANENRDVVQAKIGLLPIHVSLPTGPDYTY